MYFRDVDDMNVFFMTLGLLYTFTTNKGCNKTVLVLEIECRVIFCICYGLVVITSLINYFVSLYALSPVQTDLLCFEWDIKLCSPTHSPLACFKCLFCPSFLNCCVFTKLEIKCVRFSHTLNCEGCSRF